MRQIILPVTLAQKILGEQKKKEEVPYRLTTHCMRVERPEGILLYHTLTGELLLLSREEAKLLEELPGPVSPALEELVPKWFLRPERADDVALTDQVRDIAWRLSSKDKTLTEYLIFTTTACNARCFYCFEAGIPKAAMTEETARAAGEYIAAHCGGKPVNIAWFGGEPLVNVKAIDVISGVLRQRGVTFRSRIDSNGYLFDEALARRVKDDWGLYEAQITVDGTEEVYNSRKAFVNPDGSPFRRVLRNIGLLLDAGVQVDVRMNMDGENERDLYALVSELEMRFGGRPGFGIAPRVIIENKGTAPHRYKEDERRSLAEKDRAMWAFLDSRGLTSERKLNRGPMLYSCWSDKLNASTITPDGRLGRCESHIDRGLWGSVFSDERDGAVLQAWREEREHEELCRTCALYPRCIRLKNCVIRTKLCSAIEREEMRIRLEQAILGTYREWKAGRMARMDTV